MRLVLAAAVIASPLVSAASQEREVPRDSVRVAIPGCAHGRTFIVSDRPEHEPMRTDVVAGRRFRLNGRKETLDAIKAREGSMIEVTGLVRKSQLAEPGGIAIAGGRVRIGGTQPRAGTADPRRDPMFYEVVLDVEGWRPLAESCAAR